MEGPSASVVAQVMVGCGTVYVFHVGGGVEGVSSGRQNVRRWEFFIADRPHAPAIDATGRRQPFAQIQAAEKLAAPCDAVISTEVAALVGEACELTPLAAGGFRLEKINEVTATFLRPLLT